MPWRLSCSRQTLLIIRFGTLKILRVVPVLQVKHIIDELPLSWGKRTRKKKKKIGRFRGSIVDRTLNFNLDSSPILLLFPFHFLFPIIPSFRWRKFFLETTFCGDYKIFEFTALVQRDRKSRWRRKEKMRRSTDWGIRTLWWVPRLNFTRFLRIDIDAKLLRANQYTMIGRG